MNCRKNEILVIAMASVLGTGAVLATDQTGQRVQQGVSSAVDQAGQQAQQLQQGQQADQEILQQLRQLSQDPTTAGDKLFLLGAAVDSMTEVQLSQQAEQKSQNPRVKELAQHLIQDHQQMNQQLQQTAQQLNLRVPQSLPQIKQEEIQILASLPAQDFDQQYIAKMNEGHAKDVACFEAASTLSKNQQVKQFASTNLPKLQQHRHMVRQLAGEVGINFRSSDEATPAGAHLPGSGASDNSSGSGSTGSGSTGASTGSGTGSSGSTGSGSTGSGSPGSTGSGITGSGSTGSRTGGSGRHGAGGSGSGSSGSGASGSGSSGK